MTLVEVLTVALRGLTYVGSIAAAGGVLFELGFARAAQPIKGDLERQIAVGCSLLLLVEPARYIVFQLSIAGADWSLAFGSDLRWMGFETAMGRAALLRLIAAAALMFIPKRSAIAVSAIATAMIASFAMEGHTASSEAWTLLGSTALLIHVTAVHWWLGALYPLLALTRTAEAATLVDAVETFGRRAAWIVAGLVAAGALAIVTLTRAQLDPDSTYQRLFLLKLGLVAVLLTIAAWNKLRLTPLLRRDEAIGRARLQNSIGREMIIAVLVLFATASAINNAPDG
jgi:putative copper export protein